MTQTITSELDALFQSFQKCLELRDKYMGASLQRLGDNPRDYDGHFKGLKSGLPDVSTVRPDVDYVASGTTSDECKFDPWRIYPSPPPPHWHWRDENIVVATDGKEQVKKARSGEFQKEEVVIPEPHTWEFEIDDKGVYQVYETLDKCKWLG